MVSDGSDGHDCEEGRGTHLRPSLRCGDGPRVGSDGGPIAVRFYPETAERSWPWSGEARLPEPRLADACIECRYAASLIWPRYGNSTAIPSTIVSLKSSLPVAPSKASVPVPGLMGC